MEKNGYGLKVMRRVDGTQVRHDHAQQQFEAFTLATLAAFIQKDEQCYARESDLAYLARVDVTYFEKDGVWSFCVNEVESRLKDLFSRTDVAERVMDELVVAMRVRIRSQQAHQLALKGPRGSKRKHSPESTSNQEGTSPFFELPFSIQL
ncbi:hypothetical protein B0H14DRAFT_2575512 [Mycena olivaceomarginata]|nr:hypothetical protein B0H14DRAFT_2575512 [Mycena olivaceomarginata]